MTLILIYILLTLGFVIVYTVTKFHLLMAGYKPTTLEKALQHVADLVAERDKLKERIAELEEELNPTE